MREGLVPGITGKSSEFINFPYRSKCTDDKQGCPSYPLRSNVHLAFLMGYGTIRGAL
jgi:hypothetical protein